MESIVSLLGTHPVLKKAVLDSQSLSVLRRQWQSLPGALSHNSHVIGVRSGILSLGVYTAAWKQELLLMKSMIMTRCNQWQPDYKVTGLTIIITKKPTQSNRYKPVIRGASLAATVKQVNADRVKQGKQLCASCRGAYDNEPLCKLCRFKKNLDLCYIV